MQRLSPSEEAVLAGEIIQLWKWGWSARVQQVRKMAINLLKEKGDVRLLGKNWHLAFIKRHPELQSKIVAPRSMDRIASQERSIFDHWFDLYITQKQKYKVHDADTYNMDEKGVALGVSGKQHVIIPKTDKNPCTSAGSGSREWATSSECCSLTGRMLPTWTIFKGIRNMDKWHETMRRIGLGESGYHIATSTNGWTDNELGIAYLQDHFDVHTRDGQKGEYRILIIDGHDSHITSEAIRFCLKEKIILLCLPPHSTHFLQPCDVGLFGTLAKIYKRNLSDAYQFGETYHINKDEFLEIYHKSRDEALKVETVRSAWRKSGILQQELGRGPVDREAVFSQLPTKERPLTPTRLPSIYNGKTPGNPYELQLALNHFYSGAMDEEGALLLIAKLGKSAAYAMAQQKLTSSINEDLVKAQKQAARKKQINREGGTEGSLARVCGVEVLNRREDWGKNRQFEAAWKDFTHAAFIVVFTCNITSKEKADAAKKRRQASLPVKPKSPLKSTPTVLVPLTPFVDLTVLPLIQSTTKNLVAKHAIKVTKGAIVKKVVVVTPQETVKKARKMSTPKTPSHVPTKAKNGQLESSMPIAPIVFIKTRSGRVVKPKERS